jgi:Arc/MetJ-type ribon-helix-helix transcriptional regulator
MIAEMSFQVTLDARGEELLSAQLRSGRYHSAEEVVTHALEILSEKKNPAEERKKTPAEAVAHIRASRRGVTLGGLKIRDLIDEGRKY